MLIFLLIAAILFVLTLLFVQRPEFGALPSGERLKRIQESPHYREGKFHNENHTPQLTEGTNYVTLLLEFFFGGSRHKTPPHPIPSVQTDLHTLAGDQPILVWFGHSSYYLQAGGKRFLVDPVLSGSASPLPNSVQAFPGADIFKPHHIPDIDYLILTHDHWDHLDYKTIDALKPRIRKIICSLGVGAHLERWGIDPADIREMAWFEDHQPESGIVFTCLPARHFSGRGFKAKQSHWSSFALKTAGLNLYLGGDSGYDTHFKQIGQTYGPFDLAILENGQYDRKWRYIHMLPEEVVQAAADLGARCTFPVHSGKFSLSNHAWNDPLNRVSEAADAASLRLITPMIGEAVYLDQPNQSFSHWWKKV